MKKLLLIFSLVPGQLPGNPLDLIAGRRVESGEYEEVVRISNGRASCSATVIGEKVLLTAAHCTEEGGEVTFEYKREVFHAICSIAPDYRSAVGDQDMAVCKMDKLFPGPYASVSEYKPQLQEEVTLIGYGCVMPGGGGGNDGILRVGVSVVVRESDDEYYSYHTQGGAALCFGDSGGPSFKGTPGRRHHYITGVNSRGNIRDLSLLTAVYHPKSRQFLLDFAQAKAETLMICGLNAQCDVKQQK